MLVSLEINCTMIPSSGSPVEAFTRPLAPPRRLAGAACALAQATVTESARAICIRFMFFVSSLGRIAAVARIGWRAVGIPAAFVADIADEIVQIGFRQQ